MENKKNLQESVKSLPDVAAIAVMNTLAGEVMTNALFQAKILLNNAICSAIVLDDTFSTYSSLNKLVRKMDPKQFDEHVRKASNEFYCAITPGSYWWVRYKGCLCFVQSISRSTDSDGGRSQDNTVETRISIYGKNRKKLRKWLMETSRKTLLKGGYVESSRDFSTKPMKLRDINSIIMSKDNKDKLVSGLVNWDRDKEWYDEHSLMHKYGILLYGPGGTGKSSVIKSIAKIAKVSKVVYITADGMKSINGILSDRLYNPGNIMYVIEDVDLICSYVRKDGDAEAAKCDESVLKANLQTLFNMLDGPDSSEDTIYVLTTNYKEKLDKTLIRSGRINLEINMDYFDEDMVREYFERNCCPELIDGFLETTEMVDGKYVPSELLCYMLEDRSKKYLK